MFTHITRRYEGENFSKWEEVHPTIIFGILQTFFFTPALEHSKLHFSVWTKLLYVFLIDNLARLKSGYNGVKTVSFNRIKQTMGSREF
jgi:hypothetical protein